MVKLQLPVVLVGKLCISRGLLGDAVGIEGQTVGVEDEGAVVIQDVRTACLGCIVLGGVRGDDLRVCGQDGALAKQEAVVVGAVIGAAVVDHDHQTVDGGQADFLLQHLLKFSRPSFWYSA